MQLLNYRCKPSEGFPVNPAQISGYFVNLLKVNAFSKVLQARSLTAVNQQKTT